MTTIRAIEILEKTLKANYKFLDPDFRRALAQAIEALQDKLVDKKVE